ncbi:MAG: VCBS repeat-containing protein [Sediminicola sp.]|tara:strand:- start:28748 stop:30322 length:1575 start_codon:yes stop_codon:yes gene_type:complete
MSYLRGTLALFFLLISCSEKERPKNASALPPPTNMGGKQLAEIHCASCHKYVPPTALPKSSWKKDILPFMGNRLGIYKEGKRPQSILGPRQSREIIEKANIFPKTPLLAKSDWDKIVDYYLTMAPDSMEIVERSEKITKGLAHFKVQESVYGHPQPLTSLVKLLPDDRGVVFNDSRTGKNTLTFLTSKLEKDYNYELEDTPVTYYEKKDTIYMAYIGKNILPHDIPDGSILKIVPYGSGKNDKSVKPIIQNLQRPVATAHGDLDNDGLEDIVVCEFGNRTGKLSWFKNEGNDRYSANYLNHRPGAVGAVIRDHDQDGDMDIFALMAQGDEGIFYYENQGNGSFMEKRLLTFSPLNGSQYLELADFDGDGREDILYVCGDNADKSLFLKPYHGIYIFLNKGNLQFEQSFFYPLNGAYKAVARDFNGDGNLDIAAISYFPDYLDHPEESFVYLENKGNLKFRGSTFDRPERGRWITMDAGDMDGDGDIDLALGSFVYFAAEGDTTGLSQRWLTESPSVLILQNTFR